MYRLNELTARIADWLKGRIHARSWHGVNDR